MPAFRVRVVLTGPAGGAWVATHYMDVATSVNADSAVVNVGAFWDDVSPFICNTTSWETESEVVEYASPSTVTAFHQTTAESGVGGLSSHPVPLASQGLIRWRTSTLVGNRRVLGKTYIPSIPEGRSDIDGGLEAFTQVGLRDAGINLQVQGLVIASRAADLFAPVTGTDVWDQFAVLRSRRD